MRELRYAARQLSKSPAFALTVLLTLGLCIGADTAIFSVVDAVLLRPIPYPHPEQLGMAGFTTRSGEGEFTSQGQTGAMWEAIRDNATFIEAACVGGSGQGVNLFADGAVFFVRQQRVSAGFNPGQPPVVILGDALFQKLFHGRRSSQRWRLSPRS
jgi:putative ABC transport system permease protein